MKILIKNANIVTPYEIKRSSSLVIEDGKIINICKGLCEDGSFDDIIDAEGNYLSPGFIDIHNHGNFGHDFMEATFEAFDIMADFHIKNGVTSFLATTITQKDSAIRRALISVGEYIESGSKDSKIKAQMLGIYLEGPYFAVEKKGAQPEEYIKTPDIGELKEFIDLSKNNIKIVALAPEIDGAKEAVRFLREKGITISAAHTVATYEEAKLGMDMGITLITHLYNGMRDFSHREPGIIGAALTDERVACELICDGIHLHVGAMELAVRMKGKDGIVLVSDAMMATGLEDGKYELGGQDVYVRDGAARLEDGTLAGSTLTLDRAVYNMVHLVGVSLEDAVRMASLNPARVIGVERTKGSIEIGKDADLIVFDRDINILMAIVKGKVRNCR
ncbi:N-acetylglucosamine-6-phosphate deacetylase [Tepidimicrobium xylanilyticum]|uniref:N-acetylglucosamine-6-phosphate deacetylase n=1 Tax=Tepidimicrobium xylanilyticum TaxID=1123352 RepID=A0A1H3C9K8_9FIRM|nr:N-acetylglucosamine-6-phosphate deacetylase [Tepidimicrobium xylanilyticum]SDX50847.1 N-acetylglucosamine-6-phosphate deacetylase [Tepidimicrobium xylanilyticum]